MDELAEMMEVRAERLRALAHHPWITAEGREALRACADLYDARAANILSSRKVG
jgi:hypothetical protein